MSARALTRQELVAESRDKEQLDLGDSWNVCPDSGLCEWCLRDEDDYAHGFFAFGEMFRMRS